MPLSPFWKWVGEIFELTAPLFNWRFALGSHFDFDAFKGKYLASLKAHSDTVICPSVCSGSCRARRITELHDGKIAAACVMNGETYFQLDKSETEIHKLKIISFHESIVEALGLKFNPGVFNEDNQTWRLGDFHQDDGENIPVYVTFYRGNLLFDEIVRKISLELTGKFLLLTLVKHELSIECEDFLKRRGALLLELGKIMDFNKDGLLKPFYPPEEIFAAFKCGTGRKDFSTGENTENYLRRKGAVWIFRYKGRKEQCLLPEKGVEYLNRLLARPYNRISVESITGNISASIPARALDPGELNDGFEKDERFDETIDRRSLKEARKKLAGLNAEIEAAESENNNVDIQYLREERDDIERWIKRNVGRCGKIRSANNEKKNRMDSFRKAVKAAIDNIASYDLALALHLTENITYGDGAPGYLPEELIAWETSPVTNRDDL